MSLLHTAFTENGKKKDKESKTETTKEGEQEEYKSSESYRIHT